MTDGRDNDATSAHTGPTCPMCDEPLFDRHCKYVCPHHGVIVDCSDPFFL